MFYIDEPNAPSAVPAIPAAGAPGWFQEGDAADGHSPITVRGWWLNQVQGELGTLLQKAGLVQNKSDFSQVWQALQKLYGVGGNFAVRGTVSIIYMGASDGRIVQRFPTPTLGSSGSAFSQQTVQLTYPVAFPNGVLAIRGNDAGFAGTFFNSFYNVTATGASCGWMCVEANTSGTAGAIEVEGW